MNNTRKGLVPRETIDEIQNRSDIVEVISECGVVLLPAGRDFKALCPFHTEKTPSFTVSPQKQVFYCFGCQTGGNIFTFMQKHEGKDFRETLEWLAGRLNIDLPNQDARAIADRKRFTILEDLNRFAVEYYHQQLLNDRASAPAMQYLKHRGVQPKTLRSFQLGYASSGRRDLVKAATDKGFTIQQLIDVGLIKDEDQGPQDRFWNRILFPIQNERGAPVGFGGRALSEDHQPKYLNSPATVLYDKSKILYNLDKARQSIYKQQRVLLVEGYMDVLMLYQSGVENVVASSGTSLSEDHARLLKRFSPEVVIVYDGDASGFQAAQRGLLRLLAEDLRVRIALLPAGEDPDSFARQHGVDAFTELTDKAINLIEFLIQSAIQSQDIRQPDIKAEVVKEICEALLSIKNQIELTEYISYAAKELRVNAELIAVDLIKFQIQKDTQRKDLHRSDIIERAVKTFLSVEKWVERERFVKYVARRLHVKQGEIWQKLERTGPKPESQERIKIKSRIDDVIVQQNTDQIDVREWVVKEVVKTLLSVNGMELTGDIAYAVTYAARRLRVNPKLIAEDLIKLQIQEDTQRKDSHHGDVIERAVKTFWSVEKWVKQEWFIEHVAFELDVRKEWIWYELREADPKKNSATQRTNQAGNVHQRLTPRAQIEHQLIEALIQNPSLIPYVKSQFDCQHFTEPRFAKVAQLFWEATTNDDSQGIDIQALISECPDENLSAFISSALLRRAPVPNLQKRVDGCLKKLRNFHLQDLEQRVRSHALAEGADERETLEQLVKLSNERRALRGRDVADTHDENLNEEGVDNEF